MLNDKEAAEVKKRLNGKDAALAIIFNALSDPNRCRIFRAFIKADKLCVSDIVKIFQISMSLASQHLKILDMTKLLNKQREGKRVYYLLNKENPIVSAIIAAIK